MNWTLLTLFPLLMVCHLAPADDHRLPERFSADFELYTHGMTVARTHWSVEPAGDDSFVYESRTEPAGFYAMISNDRVLERSVWRYVGDRLRSLCYRYVRTGGKKERDIAIEFDWERNLAHNTANGDTWNMPIPAEALDKLNYVLAMMGDLAAGKQEIDYLVADGGKLKAYRLEQLGFETHRDIDWGHGDSQGSADPAKAKKGKPTCGALPRSPSCRSRSNTVKKTVRSWS